MIPKGINDEYEVVKTLRETAATAVLLVNYKKIGALRILKAIHRAHPDAHSILSEAHLLQGINSSQLPTIYSVEDTDEMYYLVEEYVEGVTLREYLLDNKLSKEELIKIAISLCNVVEALHEAKPEPLLYRDMKPEHLILQNDMIRLIDFGISVRKSEAAKAKPLGTVNWAAPEQLTGGFLDERCDIYSVGKIIEFMQINSYAKDDLRLKKLVNRLIEENLDKRIKSISTVKEMLEEIQNGSSNKDKRNGHLHKTITVVGTDKSVGTTFIAIKICRFLNRKKICAYYEDAKKDTVHNLMGNLKSARIKDGVLYHKDFKGLINYGEAVETNTPPTGLNVIDCGIDYELASEGDVIVIVMNPSPWHNNNYPTWIKNKSVHIIGNLSSKMPCITLAKELKKRVYLYPTNTGTQITKGEERIFQAILRNELDLS
ncbi:MAG: protein kinase [Pseudobutyrivibrio sp.]|nr:protein kinase [Pseudobutyrivibrio sp.]